MKIKMKSQLEINKSIRREWSFNPAERVVCSKKKYDRNRAKKEMNRELAYN